MTPGTLAREHVARLLQAWGLTFTEAEALGFPQPREDGRYDAAPVAIWTSAGWPAQRRAQIAEHSAHLAIEKARLAAGMPWRGPRKDPSQH